MFVCECSVGESALRVCPARRARGQCQGTDGGKWVGGYQGTEAVGRSKCTADSVALDR